LDFFERSAAKTTRLIAPVAWLRAQKAVVQLLEVTRMIAIHA
jgi:hypothetical protein